MVAKKPMFLRVDSEDSDRAERLPGLLWVFAGRAGGFVGFVVRRLNLTLTYEYMSQPTNSQQSGSRQIKDQRTLHSCNLHVLLLKCDGGVRTSSHQRRSDVVPASTKTYKVPSFTPYCGNLYKLAHSIVHVY